MKRIIFLGFVATLLARAQDPAQITPYQVLDTRTGVAIPCVNCAIYTYAAGTTTPQAAYTDSGLGTPLPNPVRTNTRGYAISGANAVTGIWVGSSCYKFVLKDALGVTIWTQDNICDAAQALKALLVANTGAGLIGFEPTGGTTATTVGAALNSAFLYDIGYDTFAHACAAALAAGKTLAITKTWSGFSSPNCAAGLFAFEGGILRPASGQTFIPSGAFDGDLTQHFDLSAGGAVDLSAASVAAVYTQWFGAKVDGSTVDTMAVQNTFNSVKAKTITITGIALLDGNGVYIAENSEGFILNCVARSFSCGFKAKAASAIPKMLTVLSQNVTIRDVTLNCNSTAAQGLVIANGGQGVFDNIQSDGCTSDANSVDEAGGPSSTTTSNLPSGSIPGATFTVTAAALPGCTLGTAGNYFKMVLDYGTSNQEIIQATGGGNTMTLAAPNPTTKNHNSGASIICGGNNNNLIFSNLTGSHSGGWGFNIHAGPDNNNIQLYGLQMYNNTAGGELLSGSGGIHVGGHSEVNSGYAVQLGDINGGSSNPGLNGRIATAWTIGPFGDLENTLSAYNSVHEVCGTLGSVQYRDPSEYTPAAPGSSCPAFSTYGVGGVGFGRAADGGGFHIFTFQTTADVASIGTRVMAFNPHYYYQSPNNIATECTGVDAPIPGCAGASANDAIVAQINDLNGNPLPVLNGQTRVIINLAHDCGSGCTVSVNGSTSGLASHFNYFDGPAWVRCTTAPTCTAVKYNAGIGVLDVMRLGNWVDMSQ